MEALDLKPARWVYEMVEAGFESFYKTEKGKLHYYDIASKSYQPVPGQEGFIILRNLSDKVVRKNAGSSLYAPGCGILTLEFHSKIHTMGADGIGGMNRRPASAD